MDFTKEIDRFVEGLAGKPLADVQESFAKYGVHIRNIGEAQQYVKLQANALVVEWERVATIQRTFVKDKAFQEYHMKMKESLINYSSAVRNLSYELRRFHTVEEMTTEKEAELKEEIDRLELKLEGQRFSYDQLVKARTEFFQATEENPKLHNPLLEFQIPPLP